MHVTDIPNFDQLSDLQRLELAEELITSLRDVVHSVDPDQPVSSILTMNTILGAVLVTERFGAVLMGTLAVSGLLLAAIGLYGVMAFAVAVVGLDRFFSRKA